MRSREVDARRAAARLTAAMARGAGGSRPAGGWLPPAPADAPARPGGAGERRGADLEADVAAALATELARGPRAGAPRHRGEDDARPRSAGQRADAAAVTGGDSTQAGPPSEATAGREGGAAGDEGTEPARPRWAVTATAALALVVIGALVTLLWGVRTAASAPGVPVPDRAGPAVGTTSPTSAVAPEAGAAGAGAEGQDAAAASPGAGLPTAASPGAGLPTAASPGAGLPPTAATSPQQAAARLPAGPVVVHVAGRVRRPGIARLPAGARVADALAEVGGATADADLTRVNLARPLLDGEQVLVPRPGDALPEPVPAAAAAGDPPAGAATAVSGSPGAAAGAAVQLDLNAATAADLDALPGLGPVLSGRIIELRDQLGRFSSVDELGEVSGIGEVLLDRLRPLVRV